MSSHRGTAAPAQVRWPKRATIRTVFQALVAIAPTAPLIYEAATQHDPRLATGIAAVFLAIAAGVTRVMAMPSVEAFLQRFVPFLAASPKSAAELEPPAPRHRAEHKHPHATGRHVQHDPRSRAYPVAGSVALATIRRKTWRHLGPILDQGQLGSCTGNAMTQALNTTPLRVNGRVLDESVAQHLYSLATGLDNVPGTWPPKDTGSTGLAVAKAAQRSGYISSYVHAFSFEEFLAGLMSGPAIVGTAWHQGMFDVDIDGFVHPTGPVIGGHEYLCLGVDPAKKTLTFLNSWGDTWGEAGRFHMTYDEFAMLLADQGDAVFPVR